MKKLMCFMITATLILTPASSAFAKSNNVGKQNKQQVTQNQRIKDTKKEFKIKGSNVIKYGKYKLPLSPITKGMGATAKFVKETAILTVTKGTITLIIDFKNKTTTVNGVVDTKSGIFTAKNDKKTTVLIKYIAKVLGVRVSVGKDKVIVNVPGLDVPTNVAVTPVGTTVIANTLNSTTLYMVATATITAGQATGGKAELYVDSKLVASDKAITATDSAIQFTTSDETPTNEELQLAVPKGGVVTVKLYNASNIYVTSKIANPTLVVDYIAPTITSITSAIYNTLNNQLELNVTGAGVISDVVDVTKISLFDSTLLKTYQLTNIAETKSTGVVNNTNSVIINLGTVDKMGLTGFGTTSMFLTISAGSLLTDTAGNNSTSLTVAQTVPVIVIH